MADYLVVHVISADVPSSSSTSPNKYFVELHYNGQNSTTSINENVPKWDEKTCFHRRARDDDQSSDLILEAKVYNSSKLLGRVLLSDIYFDRHSYNVVAVRHPWEDNGSGGALLLKVFLAAAAEIQLDILNLAIEDRSEGNFADQHPAIALCPADTVPKEISPNFERGRVVERMQHLFVRVVKARRLPDVDANGSLDPYVEVTFGAYNMGVTKCLKRNKNPEWNETFAFSFQHGKTPNSSVNVVVNDKDLVRDDFVGKLCFDVAKIPQRSPNDIPLEPTWYPLLDQSGTKLAQASLLLAIWIGTQSDEAYRHAWVSRYSPKVYETPRLWYLQVTILEAEGITVAPDQADSTRMFCKAWLGDLIRTTGAVVRQMTSSGSYIYVWNEDILFVAAEPFFEGDLVVSSSSVLVAGKDETIGTCTIPLASIDKRADDGHLIPPLWVDLENPAVPPQLDGSVDDGSNNSHMKISLRNLLEGGYHIGPDSQGYTDDTRPADRKLWDPAVGSVHLGILRATGLNLKHSNEGDRRSTLNTYCVAKYGDKWVRTRTIDGPDHVFNEQYTWDIYDIKTVLKVGVFDDCTLIKGSSTHRTIGKVRIHLSCLENDRIYAHSYPLVILSPSGAMKTGELHLAVKISLPSSMNMLRMYAQPTLPRMHYEQPLASRVQDELRPHAAKILALRLSQMEPPLRSEVVACICQTEANIQWSFRKSKANLARLMGVISQFIYWFGVVCSWRSPAVTLLAHAIFLLAMWFPKLVLPLVPLYGASVALWNYRLRPRFPPHVDYNLSLLGTVHPDELDEEFDTFPTSRSAELIRMRYDRLRHVAGRVQEVAGDIASLGEKIRSLLAWRDPTATKIFLLFVAMMAVTTYFVPFKVLVSAAGFYVMRHPRFRTTMPSIFLSFFQRLPCSSPSFL